MISKKELKAWVDSLPDDADVFVDDVGLMLNVDGDPDNYLVVGGEPQADDDEETGDDVCDGCHRSDIRAERTTEDGKVLCPECSAAYP